ncbi:MAG: DUF2271 domain-containing protein [Hyphomicrobiaceae bacterium]
MRVLLTIGAMGLLANPVIAAEMEIELEIPRLNVVEYHKPYVAVWLERSNPRQATTISVWYDINNRQKEGDKWLKDLRQWWRRSGRELKVPIDGVTGATRPAGTHSIKLDAGHKAIADLAPGDYAIVIEAAREVGGREVLRLPFKWPAEKPLQLEAKGQNELGKVSLNVKP